MKQTALMAVMALLAAAAAQAQTYTTVTVAEPTGVALRSDLPYNLMWDGNRINTVVYVEDNE